MEKLTKVQGSKLYHSQTWRKLRKNFIDNNPFCVNCGVCYKLVVDHIIDHNDNEFLFYNDLNFETLCSSCHFYKTMWDAKVKSFSLKKEIIIDIFDKVDLHNFFILKEYLEENLACEKIANDIIKSNLPTCQLFQLPILRLKIIEIKKILDHFTIILKSAFMIRYKNQLLNYTDFFIKLMDDIISQNQKEKYNL